MEDLFCLVKIVDGMQILFMPDGTRIPKQVKSIVIDDCNTIDRIVKVHLTLFAKLTDK